MKKEMPICQQCRIKHACHPMLSPEVIDYNGATTPITVKHTHLQVYYCRHYTCSSDGREAALRARDTGEKKKFTVQDLHGLSYEVFASAFGSDDKPTQHDMRIVTPSGRIYSLQNGCYYRAGAV